MFEVCNFEHLLDQKHSKNITIYYYFNRFKSY